MRGEHAGYLEIKLPARNRNKRFKVWCNRWVVLHKVSDLSVAKMLAKLDIYTHAEHACFPENKISSILLENVTSIKLISRSKTHPNAFEIREGDTPVLFFSAATITETQLWVCFLREIFNLNTPDTAGVYNVWIRENDYSHSLGLSGDYSMTINPNSISISKDDGKGNFQWPLSSLKKFYLRPIVPEAKHNHILILEPGETLLASGNFVMFVTPRAEEILMTIRTNIFIAMKQKSRNRTVSSNCPSIKYTRQNSLPQDLNPDAISLYDFDRSCSMDRRRPMSIFEGNKHELKEALNLDVSVSIPPPKPARTWVHIPSPTSDTPSSLEENKEPGELSPIEESILRKKLFQRSYSEAKQFSCDVDPLAQQPGDEQKFRNHCGSRDSGVVSLTSETGSNDVRRQSDRSNSTGSANSLFTDRQKTASQTNKPILQGSAITETSSRSSESDEESDDYSGSHIYWDIDPKILSFQQTEDIPRANSISLSRSHSLQNLIPKDTNPYEELVDRLKELREDKIIPPALPKRPKSLAFQKDKTFLKTSMKERFLDYISPQIKRKTKGPKTSSGADNLNMIIKDFRKWSKQQTEPKGTSPSSLLRVPQAEEWTLDQKKELFNARLRRRHLHSWSVSDASDLSWNDEETQNGVFVVERKVDPLAFLRDDPFKLLHQRHVTRQSSLNITSSIHTEIDDASPILRPVVVQPSRFGAFGSGRWSDGDTSGSNPELDLDGFPLNRRRSISLEGKLEYQVMMRELKKELRGTSTERSLAKSDLALNKYQESFPWLIPTTTSTPPTSPISPQMAEKTFGGYIEMTDRIRSISFNETSSNHPKESQGNKFNRKTSLL